jgi:aminoglycoside phosphotransferase (APT) family kinase protein
MDLTELSPLEGGWSAQTMLAEADGRRVVVRRYDAGHVPLVDAALLRRAAALVPVPEVLDVRAGRLVTSYVEGARGDLLLPTLGDAGLATLGADVGIIAATLAGTPTRTAGMFVDAELAIEPFELTLPDWVEQHEAGLAHWSADERDGLRALAEEAEARLSAVGRTSVVHSDLNPKNLIVDAESLTVAALLDWEFAHSGSPYTDLGNAVRFDRRPAWVDAVVAAYADRLGEDPSVALDLARRADLWALVELASRRGANPVADRAHTLLRAIAASRDVHAQPIRQ